MRSIIAFGSAKPLLPRYGVTLEVLESQDVIKAWDMLLVGKDEHDFHAWTKIEPKSTLDDMTVLEASKLLRQRIVVARRSE